MTEGNNTDHANKDIDSYSSYEVEMTEDNIWFIFCAVVNIVVNSIIILVILKIRLRSSTYMYFTNYAIFDIIQQMVNPIIYRATGYVPFWFHRFLIYNGFTTVYMMSMIGGIVVLFSMIMKNHIKKIDRLFAYVISGIWIGISGTGIACYNLLGKYTLAAFYTYTYLIVGTLFMGVLFIQAVIEVLHPENQLPLEYQTCTLLALAYSCSRIVLVLISLVSLMMNIPHFGEEGTTRILLGLLQLNALINLFIFLRFDVKFKAVAYNILRLNYSSGLMRRNEVTFVNLPEYVNILVNGE